MKRWCIGIAIAAVLAGSIAVGADDRATAGDNGDLAGIRVAMERLVELLETAERHERIELVLKRIELRERRLEPLQRRMTSAESELEDLQNNLDSLSAMKAQHEGYLDREIEDGHDAPGSETRRMLADIERTVEQLNERLAAADLRVAEARIELDEGREEIEDLDAMLMEMLEEPRR